MTCHRAGVWRKLVSSPIGAIDEMRFVSRSPGTLSAICQRAKRRHRRSARLVCGTGPRRQAAHVSQSSRVVRRIGGAGCRARPQRASEAKRRSRSRSRAAQKGSAHFCTTHVRRCGGAAGAAVGETSPSSGVPTLGPRLYDITVFAAVLSFHSARYRSCDVKTACMLSYICEIPAIYTTSYTATI